MCWSKVRTFEEQAYRIIFGIPAGTSGKRVVDELVGLRLQEKLRHGALRRLKSLADENELIQDSLLNLREMLPSPYTSPIEELLRMSDITLDSACLLCDCGIRHSCVTRLA